MKNIGTRESGKQARRAAILAATETLVRRSGSTNFSMLELAHESGFSVPTIYNLIGSKSEVLYAILNKNADNARDTSVKWSTSHDPVRYIMDSAEVVVRQFTSDPHFFRPLLRFLLETLDPVNRPAFMARGMNHWVEIISPLEQNNRLPPGTSAQEVSTFVHLFFTGALNMWLHEEYDDTRILVETKRYLILLLFPDKASTHYAPSL
jgi:AcrR family transcriptional regulator